MGITPNVPDVLISKPPPRLPNRDEINYPDIRTKIYFPPFPPTEVRSLSSLTCSQIIQARGKTKNHCTRQWFL